MYAHTHIHKYIYIFHSMWTSQTSTRNVWEAEPGVNIQMRSGTRCSRHGQHTLPHA